MPVQTRSDATRTFAEAYQGLRRSSRIGPHIDSRFYEPRTRKFNSSRRKRKRFLKPIKVTKKVKDEGDDDPSSTPSSSAPSAKRLFSSSVASAVSLGPVSAGKEATIPASDAGPKNVANRQSIQSTSSRNPILARSSTQVTRNNLAGAQSMEQEAPVFEEAFQTLNLFERRQSRNKMAHNTDKGKMKNMRVSLDAKREKPRKRVRARSQSVIAMQLGMGLGPLPHTPTGSRQNTPTLVDLFAGPPMRENTPVLGPVAGPSTQPGALDWRELTPDVPTRENTPQSFHAGPIADWKELTPVPTRQNTPQVEAGPSAPPGSREKPFKLDLIEEEPMDIDVEFDSSK
ncbi:uncharacterized protein EV420DRAFT_1486931 [Desarmillaria tabescens]|uniref:Uncharacterized protein n=1 Tax=Armillaria tabescens TaxID=1929756 RepID=A0AA39J824_ARMTA|nr:uncharacterized protein EV420DRAFT_1486931 [Desarmillaria tabescens]KAK0437768.1 hypothetical protein EV420DRAFT_1486931 [Desarmillaria tabescens]